VSRFQPVARTLWWGSGLLVPVDAFGSEDYITPRDRGFRARWVLTAFPNVFEFWYVANAAILHRRPGAVLTPRRAAAILAVALPLKLFQEYVLHYGRWLDSFTAVEAIWRWVSL
jgi:hypothetical protein